MNINEIPSILQKKSAKLANYGVKLKHAYACMSSYMYK